jgi:hypothetical protein
MCDKSKKIAKNFHFRASKIAPKVVSQVDSTALSCANYSVRIDIPTNIDIEYYINSENLIYNRFSILKKRKKKSKAVTKARFGSRERN